MLGKKLRDYKINWISTTPERRETVVREVTSGSEPGITVLSVVIYFCINSCVWTNC